MAREVYPDLSERGVDDLGESICQAVRLLGLEGQASASGELEDAGMSELDAMVATARARAAYCPELDA